MPSFLDDMYGRSPIQGAINPGKYLPGPIRTAAGGGVRLAFDNAASINPGQYLPESIRRARNGQIRRFVDDAAWRARTIVGAATVGAQGARDIVGQKLQAIGGGVATVGGGVARGASVVGDLGASVGGAVRDVGAYGARKVSGFVGPIARDISNISRLTLGTGPVGLGMASMASPFLFNKGLAEMAKDPGYAFDPGYASARADKMLSAALSAPGNAFKTVVKTGFMLGTVPRLANAMAGQSIKNITPFGLRSLLFGTQGVGRGVRGMMAGVGLGTMGMGPLGGVLMGPSLGRIIGGQGIGPVGKTGGLFGLFGITRGQAGGRLRAAISPFSTSETYHDAFKNLANMEVTTDARLYKTNIRTARDGTTTTRTSRVGNVKSRKLDVTSSQYKNIERGRTRPLDPLVSRRNYRLDDDILKSRGLSGNAAQRRKALRQLARETKIGTTPEARKAIRDLFTDVRSERTSMYKELKSIGKAKEDLRSTIGKAGFFSSPLNMIGIGGMPINTWKFIFKNMRGDSLLSKEAAIVERLGGLKQKAAGLDSRFGRSLKSTLLEVGDEGKKLGKNKITSTFSLKTGFGKAIDSAGAGGGGAGGGILLQGAAVNIARVMQYKYVTGKLKGLIKGTAARGLTSIKEAISISKNIGRMEFGTGKTLETQVASTERSRAISAMQNSGISARSYLGQEAALQAQGF